MERWSSPKCGASAAAVRRSLAHATAANVSAVDYIHALWALHNPMVRVDRDLAMAWAPFEFLVEGKLDHCGTDSVSLVRLEGKWLIASLAATARKACGTVVMPAR
jgi:hypothetical protein